MLTWNNAGGAYDPELFMMVVVVNKELDIALFKGDRISASSTRAVVS